MPPIVSMTVSRGSSRAERISREQVEFEVVEARSRRLSGFAFPALGTLQADQSIVVTPEIGQSIVTSIDFTDGQRIEEGEVDAPSSAFDDLRGAAGAFEARGCALTRANYQRAEQLVRQGSGTARARDEALNDFKSAEAELAAAQRRSTRRRSRRPLRASSGCAR